MPEEVRLALPGTPPSLNASNHPKAHHRFLKAKREWQSMIEVLLMEQKVPRNTYTRCGATGDCIFEVHRPRRDSGNYRTLLEKALGDALVNGGWLPDDDHASFIFGALRITNPPKGTRYAGATILRLHFAGDDDEGGARGHVRNG